MHLDCIMMYTVMQNTRIWTTYSIQMLHPESVLWAHDVYAEGCNVTRQFAALVFMNFSRQPLMVFQIFHCHGIGNKMMIRSLMQTLGGRSCVGSKWKI